MRRSANRWGYLLQQGASPLRGGIFRHDGDVNSDKAVTFWFWAYFLELYPKSVFFGRYRSVFLGITNTNTREYLGRYGTFGLKILAGNPQKIWGSPLFPKKGGLWPPFCTFHPPFEEKKEFPHYFSKKEFP